MNLAGYTIPNPDDNLLEVTKTYTMVGSEVPAGIKILALPRTPPAGYGSAYTFPHFLFKMVWSDLVTPEYANLESAFDYLIVSYARLQLDGLGISGREPYIPSVQAAELTPDEIYVTIASNAPPQIEYVEGYRIVSGVTYGPVLYKVTASFFGIDVQYLWDA